MNQRSAQIASSALLSFSEIGGFNEYQREGGWTDNEFDKTLADLQREIEHPCGVRIVVDHATPEDEFEDRLHVWIEVYGLPAQLLEVGEEADGDSEIGMVEKYQRIAKEIGAEFFDAREDGWPMDWPAWIIEAGPDGRRHREDQ